MSINCYKQGCGAGAGADTFWSEPEPEPPKRLLGAGAVKNGAAPAPKSDTIEKKITECQQRNNKQPNKQIAYVFHQSL